MRVKKAVALAAFAILFAGCAAKPKIDFDVDKSVAEATKIPTEIRLEGIPDNVRDSELEGRISGLIRQNTAFSKGKHVSYVRSRAVKYKGFGYLDKEACSDRRYGDYAYNRYVFSIKVVDHVIRIKNNSTCFACLSNERSQYLDNGLLAEAGIRQAFPAGLPACDYTEPNVREFIEYLPRLKEDLAAIYGKEAAFRKQVETLAQTYPAVRYINNPDKIRQYSKWFSDLSDEKQVEKLLATIDEDIEGGIEYDLKDSLEQYRSGNNAHFLDKEMYWNRFGYFSVSRYTGRTDAPYVQYKIAAFYEKHGDYENALKFYEAAQSNGLAMQKHIDRMKDRIRYAFYYRCRNAAGDAEIVNCGAAAAGNGKAFGNLILEEYVKAPEKLTRSEAARRCGEYVRRYRVDETGFGGRAIKACLGYIGY